MAEISIITSTVRKQIMFNHIENYGTNLTEWFNTKSEEILKEYIDKLQDTQVKSPSSLAEISDKDAILKLLSTINWDFSKSDTLYLTHDIHPFPAKFIPQIPAHLIAALSLPGELVWDPFGGSGTTALESLLLHRRCISLDANPLATLIGECKTLTLNQKEQQEISLYLSWINDIFNNGDYSCPPQSAPPIPNIENWFHQNAIQELSFIKQSFATLTYKCKILASIAFSRTVSRVSNQENETRYACKPRDIEKGETIRFFIGNLNTVLFKVLACGKLLQGRTAQFLTYDLRALITDASIPIHENQVDLIVTSPPYANVTDYHLYHRFRMFWLGLDPVQFGREEIGSHLRHQKEKTVFEDYMKEIALCLNNCFRSLRPGRYAVFVVGNSIFNKIEYDTAEYYKSEAVKIGFEYVGRIERSLPDNKRSFETPARRARQESLLILRKPPKQIEAELFEVPYKLWDYENDLMLREITQACGAIPKKEDNKTWSIKVNCYCVDRLKRLTFLNKFKSSDFHEELTWQSIIENGNLFNNLSQRKESKYVTHGIHEFKGKFYAQLCKCLLNLANINTDAIILDPFMGSGTTILESYLNGYQAYGCDINPLAVNISKAKVDLLEMDPYLIEGCFDKFISLKNFQDPFSDYLIDNMPPEIKKEALGWFPLPVLKKIGFLLEQIERTPDPRLRNFLKIILSNNIRGVSQQHPEDLRIRRRPKQIDDAPVIELFCSHLMCQLKKLMSFYNSRQYSPFIFNKAKIWQGDARLIENFHNSGLCNGSVDAIITSPPYATALPYIDTDRLSLLILYGLNTGTRDLLETSMIGTREIKKTTKEQIEQEIEQENFERITSVLAIDTIKRIYSLNKTNDVGFRRKNMASLLYQYFNDLTICMNNINDLVKTGGSIFIVIGDNVTTSDNTTIKIQTTEIIKRAGMGLGWVIREEIPITVTKESMKHQGNAITHNTILCFNK